VAAVATAAVFSFAGGLGLAGEKGAEAIVPSMRDRRGRFGVSAERAACGAVHMAVPASANSHSDSDVRTQRRTGATTKAVSKGTAQAGAYHVTSRLLDGNDKAPAPLLVPGLFVAGGKVTARRLLSILNRAVTVLVKFLFPIVLAHVASAQQQTKTEDDRDVDELSHFAS
jgi:phage-related minor tail protein